MKKSHKLFAFESFDDSIRRFQRLREIRKNLRTKYDNYTEQELTIDENSHSNKDSVRKVTSSRTTNPVTTQPYDQTSTIVKARDRKNRSRTLDSNQIRAVDNQVCGSASSKTKQAQHRSEAHKNRSNRLSFRRSSEDIQDKKLQLKRHLHSGNYNSNETWFEVEREHWSNLLENGWRPTADTSGINLVSFTDSGKTKFIFKIYF